MTNWEQSINWHLNQYEKTGKLYHLAAALTHFKRNLPNYYEKWQKNIIKQIRRPEPIRDNMNENLS